MRDWLIAVVNLLTTGSVEEEEKKEEKEEFGFDIPLYHYPKESQSGSHSPFPSSPTTNTL